MLLFTSTHFTHVSSDKSQKNGLYAINSSFMNSARHTRLIYFIVMALPFQPCLVDQAHVTYRMNGDTSK